MPKLIDAALSVAMAADGTGAEAVAAASVTRNVAPPIDRFALRTDVPVFAVAVKLTVVDPLPVLADETVSHDALLLAVHAQPAPVVSVTLPLPPFDAKLVLVELSA